MKVSVIIATYNRSDYLKDIIFCLQKQTMPSDQFEILIVDNSLDGRFKDFIGSLGIKNCRYIWEKRPGAHRARNTGGLLAQGEILMFLDDDELFEENLLDLMTQAFTDKRIGCVGGKMLPKFEAPLPDFFSLFNPGDTCHLDLGEEPRILKTSEEIWGGNMAVRRDVFLRVGGLNPDIFPNKFMWLTGDGEGGLQIKIRNDGYEIFYEPRSFVYNRIGASRLTESFLVDRRTYRAITMSFTNIRLLNKKRFFLLHVLRHSIRCYLNYIYYSLFKKFSHRIEKRIESLYWRVRGEHHLRAFLDWRFRSYVVQDSYL